MSNPLESLSFHALFDAAADALILADADGNITLANPAACELFGYEAQEILGLTVEMLMPVRFREGHRRYRSAFIDRPEKRAMGNGKELLGLSRDGRELMVDIGLSPLRADGQSYVLITFFDATRSRKALKALRESEERLRLAKRAAGVGIFDHNLHQGTIQLDEQARDLWGIGREEVVTDERLLANVRAEDRLLVQGAMQRALHPEGSGEYYAEFRTIERIGKIERWVVAAGQVFFDDEQAMRLVGTIRDITVQKTIERKLSDQRADMEALLKRQVAAQTASAIAHELNQPLAALSAYSEVALHELDQIDCPEKLRRSLAGCVEQAHRAGKSLHELLEFLHKGDLVSAPININETVGDAIVISRDDGLGGFHSVLELEQNMPPVLANRLQIQKVLINLIRNGVEAMREGGMPASAITVKVQTLRGQNMALITVQDSGPGLDAKTAKRIFEPFFTSKPHGIGMGLAISRSLVEANGGQLWVDPETEAGATFHFTLPLAS